MSRMIGKLPPDAEALLKSAAATGAPGSLARRVAIDRALDRVAEDYPEHFKSEKRETNMKVTVPARGSFLNLFTPKPYENGPPTYNGKFIIDPSDRATVKALDDAMMAVARAKWSEKAQKIFDNLVKTGKPKTIEVGFVKDEYTNGDGDAYDGFEGMYYISAKADPRRDPKPLIIDADTSPLIESDGRPYSGCYVNVQIEFWAQDNNYGKGIRATLKAVQFVKDGDAFSGGSAADVSAFTNVSDGADAAGLA